MLEQPTTKPEEVIQGTPTLGGVPIDVNPVESEPPSDLGFSFEQEKPEDKALVDFSIPQGMKETDPVKLNNQIDKYSFALGKHIPQETIASYLEDGHEESLRQLAAEHKNIEDEKTKNETIKDLLLGGVPSDPNEQSILYRDLKALHSYKPDNNPMTVVEKAYAERYANTVPFMSGDNLTEDYINNASNEFVDKSERDRIYSGNAEDLDLAETAKRILVSQEIAKENLAAAEEKFGNQSIFGKIKDFAKSAVPFLDYYNMTMDVPGMEAYGIYPGITVAQWVTKLHDQSPEVQKQMLAEATNKIGDYNPLLAIRVAEAAVNYSSNDELLDNVFGVLDVTDVSQMASVAIKGGVTLGLAYKGLSKVNAYKTAIKANAKLNPNGSDVLAAMGDYNGAAVSNALKVGSKGSTGVEDLSRSTPTVLDPFSPPGASQGNAALQSARFQDFIRGRGKANELTKEVTTTVPRINRLPEESLQTAFQRQKEEFKNTIEQTLSSSLQNTSRVVKDPSIYEGSPVVNSREIRPEDTPYNVGTLVHEISKPNGELFSGDYDFAEVKTWAKWMGLEIGDYGVQNKGSGWVITVTRPLDETRPYVRDSLISLGNKNVSPTAGLFTGLTRMAGGHGGGRVSEFANANRIAYTVGQEKFRAIIEPLVNDFLQLKEDSVKALNRVMDHEHTRLHPQTQEPGHFFVDNDEFVKTFRTLVGRSPSVKEQDSYWSARTLNDLEFNLRNSSFYGQQARLGIKDIELPSQTLDKAGNKVFGKVTFKGKVIDELPVANKDAKDRAYVTLYRQGEEPKIIPLNTLLTEKGALRLSELKKEGYTFIQTANPVRKPGKEIFGEDKPVNFIITKDFKEHPLTSDFKYREGWHSIQKYKFYVKQPVIRKVEEELEGGYKTVHHNYEGDTVLFGFNTKAEANKYANAMNIAVKLYREGKTAELKKFLAENLPFSVKKFKTYFEALDDSTPGRFSKDHQFFALGDGEITMDSHRELLNSTYENMYDTVRSPWNLVNQLDKKFIGHRDEVVHTVIEGKGSQGNPVFSLAKGEQLDPMAAMSEGISNMIRNQQMIDLRTQVAESWVEEFKKLLQPESQQAMYNDLNNVIMQPKRYYVQGIETNSMLRDDYLRAENARLAFLELVNLETPLQANLDHIRSGIMDGIYERLGQKASNEWSDANIMTTRHPLSFLRGIVYHAKVGMLNPIPALQNATQMANAVAISPVHGTAGFTFGLMSYFGRLNSRPGILSALGEIAEKATGGKYKKEWFIDAQRALRDSGYLEIGGSHALGDYLNEPKFYQRKFGKALDASSVLFTQSEKLLSSSAYMTSYLEFRSANPTKVLTSIDYNEILNRANLYAGRMRRNDKARWQSGEVLSSFTQFWSYPARLMEMIWEKGHGRKDMLTGAEKLRLLAANSILYGIPIGLGGTAVGGVFNTYDYMKQKFSENGIDTDSGTLAKLFDGVVGTMSKNAVGVNLSPTFGPIGRDLTQTLEQDNGWFRFILGPTGGTFLDTIHSAKPAYRSAWMAVNGELKPSVLAGDLLNIARNVSSINKMTAMYLAYKNKNIYTKMGQPMTNEIGGEGKLDTWTALVSAITGQVPSEIDHDMWHMKILSNLTEVKQDLAKQAQQDYRLHLQAEAEGNRDLSMFYLRRSSILLGGMPMRERLEIIKKSMDGDKALIDTIEKKWEQHDPTVTDHFIETYGEYFKNAPKKETE